ncbi:MAG: hypothetical protein WDM85_14920 [Caulobacteraceae bacterium]
MSRAASQLISRHMTAEPEASTGGRSSAAALYTLLSVMFINMLGFGVIVPFLPYLRRLVPRGALADRPGVLGLFDRLLRRRAVLGAGCRTGSGASRS